MNYKSPTITVLMAVYNGEQYLDQAVKSILDQSFSDFEFIVIDDCSTDRTSLLLKKYQDSRLKVHKNKKNIGQVPSLNVGLKLAQGEFIARMDADDIANPNRLQKQVDFLINHKQVLAVGSDVEVVGVSGQTLFYQPTLVKPAAITAALAVGCPLLHPSVMMRLRAAMDLDGYDSATAEDYDLWERLSLCGDLANIPEPLLKYRLNPGGLSVSRRQFFDRETARIQQRRWDKDRKDGPAPTKLWPEIWPDKRKLIAPRRNEFFMYGQLHLQFALGYRQRGLLILALRHWLASFRWILNWPHPWFYSLMFVLPWHWFRVLEQGLVARGRKQLRNESA